MRYITLAADYTGSYLSDDFQGGIDCRELLINEELCKMLDAWNTDYKLIIPLGLADREKRYDEINKLDERGIFLAKKLTRAIPGGAKVKYFSEGRLQLLNQKTMGSD